MRLNYSLFLAAGGSALLLFASACSTSSANAAPVSDKAPGPTKAALEAGAKAAAAFPAPPDEIRVAAGGADGLTATAVFAGGCFWGVEGVFERLAGVKDVVSGYSGGTEKDAQYDLVSTGATGHAEAVKIDYDPAVVSYGTLLRVFFHIAHDPTQLNYQGPDHGPQYRSAIFYLDEAQKRTAEAYIARLTEAKAYPAPIVTVLAPLDRFYPAEGYHQDFMRLNPDYPYIVYHDRPKVEALERIYPNLLVKGESMNASNNPAPDGTWQGLPVYESEEKLSFPIQRSDAEWRKLLGDFGYEVLRRDGTERAFTGPLLEEHRPGTFYSAATGQPLFRSEDKFDSGTGWPSFTRAISDDAVIHIIDRSYGMERVEVIDSSSGSHLGHVFEDGPTADRFERGTGLRYCMNSVSLLFVADGDTPPPIVAEYAAKAAAADSVAKR